MADNRVLYQRRAWPQFNASKCSEDARAQTSTHSCSLDHLQWGEAFSKQSICTNLHLLSYKTLSFLVREFSRSKLVLFCSPQEYTSEGEDKAMSTLFNLVCSLYKVCTCVFSLLPFLIAEILHMLITRTYLKTLCNSYTGNQATSLYWSSEKTGQKLLLVEERSVVQYICDIFHVL